MAMDIFNKYKEKYYDKLENVQAIVSESANLVSASTTNSESASAAINALSNLGWEEPAMAAVTNVATSMTNSMQQVNTLLGTLSEASNLSSKLRDVLDLMKTNNTTYDAEKAAYEDAARSASNLQRQLDRMSRTEKNSAGEIVDNPEYGETERALQSAITSRDNHKRLMEEAKTRLLTNDTDAKALINQILGLDGSSKGGGGGGGGLGGVPGLPDTSVPEVPTNEETTTDTTDSNNSSSDGSSYGSGYSSYLDDGEVDSLDSSLDSEDGLDLNSESGTSDSSTTDSVSESTKKTQGINAASTIAGLGALGGIGAAVGKKIKDEENKALEEDDTEANPELWG